MVDLGVICISVNADVESTKHISEGKEVNNKKESQNRALWHNESDSRRLGCEGLELGEKQV